MDREACINTYILRAREPDLDMTVTMPDGAQIQNFEEIKMEHLAITESSIDDWEMRVVAKSVEVKSLCTNMAQELRHHIDGLRRLQQDGQFDDTELARLRSANIVLKQQIADQCTLISELRADLIAIRGVVERGGHG